MAQAEEWRGSPSGGAVGSGRPGPWNRLWDARVLGFRGSLREGVTGFLAVGHGRRERVIPGSVPEGCARGWCVGGGERGRAVLASHEASLAGRHVSLDIVT